MNTESLEQLIENSFEERNKFSPGNTPTDVADAVEETLNLLTLVNYESLSPPHLDGK